MGEPTNGGFDPFQDKVYPPCDGRSAVEHRDHPVPPLTHWEGADGLCNIFLGHREGCGMFFRNSNCGGGEYMSDGVGVDA